MPLVVEWIVDAAEHRAATSDDQDPASSSRRAQALVLIALLCVLGLAAWWYERYLKKLRTTDPEAAKREITPTAERMIDPPVETA